jgi:hypothetical protein
MIAFYFGSLKHTPNAKKCTLKIQKMHTKQCKKHTNLKNAKNDISVLTDILPGGGELK